MDVAGWTIEVIRIAADGSTSRELWDCAIALYADAEARVLKETHRDNLFRIKGIVPLSAYRLHHLGVKAGTAKKREA